VNGNVVFRLTPTADVSDTAYVDSMLLPPAFREWLLELYRGYHSGLVN
jgi:hypothetical protein